MARSFDGVDDKIVWGTSAVYAPTAWSATAWIKFPANTSLERQIFSKQTALFIGRLYLLLFPGVQNSIGTVATRNAAGASPMAAWSTADTLTAGVWNFVAATYDGGVVDTNVHIYQALVNRPAAEVSYASRDAGTAGAFDAGTNLMIGAREPLDATFWLGQLADVRLYNIQLTLNEIIQIQYGKFVRYAQSILDCPLWGQNPENDISSIHASGALTGTTVTNFAPFTTFTQNLMGVGI